MNDQKIVFQMVQEIRAEAAVLHTETIEMLENMNCRLEQMVEASEANTEFLQRRTYELLKRSNRLHMLEFVR